MLKCIALFALLCIGSCLDGLFGSTMLNPDNPQDLDSWKALRENNSPLKRFKPITESHWSELEKEIGRPFPLELKLFHEAFEGHRHPGQGHWGRIPSKKFKTMVWEAYLSSELEKGYFPITANGEDFCVLDLQGNVRIINEDYNCKISTSLFTWVKGKCPTEAIK
jgi:hypothetical protein